MLLMHFLENKVTFELTRSEFVKAQQACERVIEMPRGHYAHSLACFDEEAFHFIESLKQTERKSIQSMCHAYATVSYICSSDAESSSKVNFHSSKFNFFFYSFNKNEFLSC
ncbi:hypothetical protein QJS04_geneDACA024116 [Acorus gramineus]|uniref:Uncharacterized protein n=1 Tax=Acorus gramineus TaxID=55184 RepID=A0AAV9A264_ACOGR|nr:hypothetical protein QJS04_geneDACA024116 [Acorus gramineus]